MAEIIQINDTTWRIEDGGVRFSYSSEQKRRCLLTTV